MSVTYSEIPPRMSVHQPLWYILTINFFSCEDSCKLRRGECWPCNNRRWYPNGRL